MTLLYVAAGCVLAALPGAYLPGSGWPLPVGILCLALWLGLLLTKRQWRVRPAVLGAALALLWLTAYGAIFHAPAQAMENRTVRLEAVVVEWPEETDYGCRITVRAGEADGRKGKAIFYGESTLLDLRPGDRLSCVARCTPADRMAGEESLYYPSKGVLLKLKGYGPVEVDRAQGVPARYALTILAGTVRERIDQLYPEKQAGFLRALLTGDKSGLDQVDQNNFKRVGLSHVVVISGLHVSFLLGFLTLFLKPERRGSLVLLLAGVLCFTLMTGSAPGTVRAAILATLSLIGTHIRRETHPMVSLSAGLLVLLALNPYAIANPGLQFSFLSTVGIFVFGQPWSRAWLQKFPRPWRRWVGPLVGTVAVSLGTMLFTVPLSALYFGQFSLIAPLSNLLTTWAVSVAFLGGLLSVVLGFVYLPLGQLVAVVVGWPVDGFFWYSAAASRFPLAAVGMHSIYYTLWILLVYGLVLLYLFAPLQGKRPMLPLCVCVAALCFSTLLTVESVRRWDMVMTVLDVGQGQSIVFTSGSACALVDCGGSYSPGDTAAGYLQSLGRSSIDLLVLTHYDSDHAGGVPELMGRMQVNAIAMPDFQAENDLRQEIEALAAEAGTPIHYITTTSRADFGKGELRFYAPVGDGEGSNENCLAVLARSGEWEALVTGDMPIEAEERLLAREDLPDVEVLVAGHHGSKYSTGKALLEQTRPETAVISVGRNTFGHPTQDVLDRLSAIGAEIYRTDGNGTITLYANGNH